MKKHHIILILAGALFACEDAEVETVEGEPSTRKQELTMGKRSVHQPRGLFDFANLHRNRRQNGEFATRRDYNAAAMTRSTTRLTIGGLTHVDEEMCTNRRTERGSGALANGSQISTAFHLFYPFMDANQVNVSSSFGFTGYSHNYVDDTSHPNTNPGANESNPEHLGGSEESYRLIKRLFVLGLDDWIGADYAKFRQFMIASSWMYGIDDWSKQRDVVILSEQTNDDVLEISHRDFIALSLKCPKNINGGVLSTNCKDIQNKTMPFSEARRRTNAVKFKDVGISFSKQETESDIGTTSIIPTTNPPDKFKVPRSTFGLFKVDRPALFFNYVPHSGISKNDVVLKEDILIEDNIHGVDNSQVTDLLFGKKRFYIPQQQTWPDNPIPNFSGPHSIVDYDANANFNDLAGLTESLVQTCFESNDLKGIIRIKPMLFGAAGDGYAGSSGSPFLSPRFYSSDPGYVFGGPNLNSIGILSGLISSNQGTDIAGWNDANPSGFGIVSGSGTDPEEQEPPVALSANELIGVKLGAVQGAGIFVQPITLLFEKWLNEREFSEEIEPPSITDEDIRCLGDEVNGVCQKQSVLVCPDGPCPVDINNVTATIDDDTKPYEPKEEGFEGYVDVYCHNKDWRADHNINFTNEIVGTNSLAVGIVGSARLSDQMMQEGRYAIDAETSIGNIGLVCAPWYFGSWTENYNYMYVSAVRLWKATQNIIADEFYGKWKDVLIRAFEVREQLITSANTRFDKRGESREVLVPASMKMCPPNYLLNGMLLHRKSDNTYGGVVELYCIHSDSNATGSEDSYGAWETDGPKKITVQLSYDNIPGKNTPVTWYGDALDVSAWIGNPNIAGTGGDPVFLECPTDDYVIEGFRVAHDINQRLRSINIHCLLAPGHN
tara:strand:- start:257 stop:2929 length:2673 start_codon:yes stop_codon:yes gene_type:complete